MAFLGMHAAIADTYCTVNSACLCIGCFNRRGLRGGETKMVLLGRYLPTPEAEGEKPGLNYLESARFIAPDNLA